MIVKKIKGVFIVLLLTLLTSHKALAISLFEFKESANPFPLEFREIIGFSYVGFSSTSEKSDYKTHSLSRVFGVVGVNTGIYSREINYQYIRKFFHTIDIRVKTVGSTLQTEYLNKYPSEDKLFIYSAHISPKFLFLYGDNTVVGFSPELGFTRKLFIINHSYSIFGYQKFKLKNISEKIKSLPLIVLPTFTLSFDRSSSNNAIDEVFRTPSSVIFSVLSSAEHSFGGIVKTAGGLRITGRYFFDGKTAISLSPIIKVSPIDWLVISGGAELSLGVKSFGTNYPMPYFIYFGAHIIGGMKKGINLIKIYGKVVDENQKPIEGAVVYEEEGYGAISQKDGSFTLQIPEEKENLKITASKEGFNTTSATLPKKDVIIQLTAKQEVKQPQKLKVFGKIIDEEENGLPGQIFVYESQKMFEISPNGEFSFETTAGRYSLLISSEGFYSRQIDVEVRENENLQILAVLPRIKGGLSILEFSEGENIFFNVPRVKFDRLTGRIFKESYGALDAFAEYLKKNTDFGISIEVYVDESNNPRLDKNITKIAAEGIKGYLIAKGIKEDRISAEGKGSEIQVAPNDTPENRERNRRILFKKITDLKNSGELKEQPKTEEKYKEEEKIPKTEDQIKQEQEINNNKERTNQESPQTEPETSPKSQIKEQTNEEKIKEQQPISVEKTKTEENPKIEGQPKENITTPQGDKKEDNPKPEAEQQKTDQKFPDGEEKNEGGGNP